MILADENIHGLIINNLRGSGYPVTSVREGSSGITDIQVIHMALQQDDIILTQDKDFGEWVFSHHVKNISVLLLRYALSDELAYVINRMR